MLCVSLLPRSEEKIRCLVSAINARNVSLVLVRPEKVALEMSESIQACGLREELPSVCQCATPQERQPEYYHSEMAPAILFIRLPVHHSTSFRHRFISQLDFAVSAIYRS